MPDDHPLPPLTLPPDQMRRLGYQMVDLVVDALAGLRERPPSRRAGPEELAGLLAEPLPRAGSDPEAVLGQAVEKVLGPAMRVDHPRFFAYVPIPSNYVGMLADALASGFGVFAGTWQAASGAAAAELATLRWLRELFGLPETAGGLFLDGGSSANAYGLVAARRARLGDRLEGAVLYASDQTHSWIGRAAGLLGFHPSSCGCSPPTPSSGCRRPRWRRRWRPTGPPGGGRSAWSPPRARPAPAASTRWPSWPPCAGPRACGSTSTGPSAPRPS
jgi:aromatic-L-amino-acid decarboxylase